MAASSQMSVRRGATYVADDYDEEDEKQISVDPVSVNRPPPVLPPRPQPRFVSASLPCSTTSSPESRSMVPKSSKEWFNPAQLPHPAFHLSLARQSSVAQPQYSQKGTPLLRSKSCGDGRSSQPSDEFNIFYRRHRKVHGLRQSCSMEREQTSNAAECCKQEAVEEEEFKCGAMCLFLPGFVKKKQEQAQQLQCHHAGHQAKPQQRDDQNEEEADDDEFDEKEKEESRTSAVSRVASLERFECASWSSAAIIDDIDDSVSAYFDLPLELIRGTGDDPLSPVKTAFVFDREPKGVLKKNTSRSTPRKSCGSSGRHVTFSMSVPVSHLPSPLPSPTTSGGSTPKMFRGGEEFSSALLEAQSANINFELLRVM